jgi:hypothetical protein
MTRAEAQRVMVLLGWLLDESGAPDVGQKDSNALAAATQLHAAARERLGTGTGFVPGHIGRAWPGRAGGKRDVRLGG